MVTVQLEKLRAPLFQSIASSEETARSTATYRRWLDSYTQRHRITVLTAPKGVRKEQVVAPYYRSFKADAGEVCAPRPA